MTSTITAETTTGTRLADVFTALFPCGSVTGAPKARAMHHIARLETATRGVYCGAMGILSPGGRATFNVPIRTVCIHTPPPSAPWTASCGIGSGITLDAQAPQEMAEWQHKTRFLLRASQDFELLESLRLQDGTCFRVARHLTRLKHSMEHFGWAWPSWADAEMRILEGLQELAAQHPQGLFKVRLRLSIDGGLSINADPLTGPAGPAWPTPPSALDLERLMDTTTAQRTALAAFAMPEANDFIWHKTTWRKAYAPFSPAPSGTFDTLLFNSAGLLTEFTIGNVAARIGGEWLTPPVRDGLLPGVMRACLLDAGVLKEASIPLSMLPQAQGLVLINSVRGCIPMTPPNS